MNRPELARSVCAFMALTVLCCDSKFSLAPDGGAASEADGGSAVASQCGRPCGECGAGTIQCDEGEECRYPSSVINAQLLDAGLEPINTGSRPTFRPDSFTGVTPRNKLDKAVSAAGEVGGAVVLDKIYELDSTLRIPSGVLLTGGGLRRTCTPIATLREPASIGDRCVSVDQVEGFSRLRGYSVVSDASYEGHLGVVQVSEVVSALKEICFNAPLQFAAQAGDRIISTFPLAAGRVTQTEDIVFDSVFFDGNGRCNHETRKWTLNGTLNIRGSNRVRNSVFYDIPSENITSCGATIENNIALNLSGSFVHKSCGDSYIAREYIRGNYVQDTNSAGDALMKHSEGLITFSRNAGNQRLSANVFRNGAEGVFGAATSDDRDVVATGDCYAHFPQLIEYAPDAPSSTFHLDVELIDVGDAVKL